MKTYWSLTEEQKAQVDSDHKVVAADGAYNDALNAATAAATAVHAAASAAHDAAYNAYTLTRDEAAARMFKEENQK